MDDKEIQNILATIDSEIAEAKKTIRELQSLKTELLFISNNMVFNEPLTTLTNDDLEVYKKVLQRVSTSGARKREF